MAHRLMFFREMTKKMMIKEKRISIFAPASTVKYKTKHKTQSLGIMERLADIAEPQSEEAQSTEICIYCGSVVDEGIMCDCQERKKALLDDIALLDDMALEHNESLGVSELYQVQESSKGIFEFAYNMYKLGVLRSRRTAELTTCHNI